jgi:hypothetical protein
MSRKTKKRQTHSFTLVLSGISDPDARIEDALYEAGCDDALLAFRNEVAYLEFDREADTFEAAIVSAVRDAESAAGQITVSSVEPSDLVTASEIARRLDCTREYVRLLVQGKRGEGGFPAPLSGVTSTNLLWSWAAVLKWLSEHDRLTDESELTRAETICDINGALDDRLQPGIIKRRRSLIQKLRRAH